VSRFLAAADGDRAAAAAEWAALVESRRDAFVYGWGSPVASTRFGGAVPAIWKELQHFLFDS
jgi:hypothetical protein